MNGGNDRAVKRRGIVIPDDVTVCSVHLINGGVTVRGHTAVVEFAAKGPYDSLSCNLDNQGYSTCECLMSALNLNKDFAGAHSNVLCIIRP